MRPGPRAAGSQSSSGNCAFASSTSQAGSYGFQAAMISGDIAELVGRLKVVGINSHPGSHSES